MQIVEISFYLAISLVLILEVTKAYKKSYSTTLIVWSCPIIVWLNNNGLSSEANYLLILICSILLIRAIINTKMDKLIKRGNYD